MVDHYIPKTLEEALELLSNHNALIIAGGTDIMVQKRSWNNLPPKINSSVNIRNLPELNYITLEKEVLCIGATTTLNTIYHHENVPLLLKQAISVIASPAIRNMATIAGNIGNASPAGDTLPVLYLLEAIIVLKNKYRIRELPINEVIIGPRKTVIQNDEIITEIKIPLTEFTKCSFDKIGGRKADAISKISLASLIRIEQNIVKDIRFAFGAVGPKVIRDKKIEETLIGLDVHALKKMKKEISSMYRTIVTPIDDQRSTKEYRKHVAGNLIDDFINHI
jgi:CO/xanthine dehydrogenase FAD-binding subunit